MNEETDETAMTKHSRNIKGRKEELQWHTHTHTHTHTQQQQQQQQQQQNAHLQ